LLPAASVSLNLGSVTALKPDCVSGDDRKITVVIRRFDDPAAPSASETASVAVLTR
jgi:hypothetical protein